MHSLCLYLLGMEETLQEENAKGINLGKFRLQQKSAFWRWLTELEIAAACTDTCNYALLVWRRQKHL